MNRVNKFDENAIARTTPKVITQKELYFSFLSSSCIYAYEYKSENGQSSETIPANIFPRPSSLSAILILSEKVNRTLDNESILKNVYDIISKLSAENQTGLKVKIILRTEASNMNFDSVIFDEKLSHVNYTLRGFNNVRNEIKTTYPAVYYSNLIFSDHYID